MTTFNFKPIFEAIGNITKVDLPHGLSLMVYIARDDQHYDEDYLLGDDWKFVRFPCQQRGFGGSRNEDALGLLGIDYDGTPDLEKLLDDHKDAVLKAVRGEPFAGDFTEFQGDDQIEWLREGLYEDARITEAMTKLWNTGIATDPKVVVLDVYSHSGETWSFTGGGEQCRFDTARGAGCLLPSDAMRKQLDEQALTDTRPMTVLARENAKDFLAGFNSMNTGDVYQIVAELVETATGDEVASSAFPESRCGYLGYDHADDNLEEQTNELSSAATEVAVARNAAWVAKLDKIANRIFSSNDGSTNLGEAFAAYLPPPSNLKWSELDD